MSDVRCPTADTRYAIRDTRSGVVAAFGVELVATEAMSKHNNVNPGQYKVGGRLHPGDDSSKQEQGKAQASIEEHQLREEARKPKKQED